MSAQPLEKDRFLMFFLISQLVVFVASGMGLMIGAWFDVVVNYYFFLSYHYFPFHVKIS